MSQMPYVADRAMVADAAELVALYGEDAVFHAAKRADHSRDIGNVVHFCRWRQIERLAGVLASDDVTDTVH